MTNYIKDEEDRNTPSNDQEDIKNLIKSQKVSHQTHEQESKYPSLSVHWQTHLNVLTYELSLAVISNNLETVAFLSKRIREITSNI